MSDFNDGVNDFSWFISDDCKDDDRFGDDWEFNRKNVAALKDIHDFFTKNAVMTCDDFVGILRVYYPNPSEMLLKMKEDGFE